MDHKIVSVGRGGRGEWKTSRCRLYAFLTNLLYISIAYTVIVCVPENWWATSIFMPFVLFLFSETMYRFHSFKMIYILFGRGMYEHITRASTTLKYLSQHNSPWNSYERGFRWTQRDRENKADWKYCNFFLLLHTTQKKIKFGSLKCMILRERKIFAKFY